eukprot:GHVL01004745.1.p1 GENE.GHVL01004745.1~~GHVL01004745.1.p1  ORF type:complete len:297 (+),score=6.75 GHVL01004745.1:62-952(+)
MASSRQIKLFTVDAFANRAFEGNPAAVCPLNFDTDLDDDTLQKVAIEMNLSETAYIRPLNATDDHRTGNRFGLRWFTTTQEVKLCGHATLASAAVLFYEIGNTSDKITFETLSGELVVRRDGDHLLMDFPTGLTQHRIAADYDGVIKALGVLPGVQDVTWCPSLSYLLVRLNDGWTRADFEQWQPDIGQLERSVTGVIVLIVTTRGGRQQGFADQAGRDYDFVSRCFAPWSGIAEDPVTGSAQTVLAYYWGQQLAKEEFYTRQCSQRGGEIQIRVEGDRVHLRGKATLVLKGVLHI